MLVLGLGAIKILVVNVYKYTGSYECMLQFFHNPIDWAGAVAQVCVKTCITEIKLCCWVKE